MSVYVVFISRSNARALTCPLALNARIWSRRCSVVAPGQVESAGRILVILQILQHLLGTQGLFDDARVVRAYEASAHSVLHPLNQARPVALHVVHNHGHAVDAQLVPRRDLHQLFKRAISTGQGDKATARPTLNDLPGHHLLARVHVLDDSGTAEDGLVDLMRSRIGRVVVLLEFDQRGRNDAVHALWPGQRNQSPRNFAHQAYGAAAVDEVRAAFVQGFGEQPRGLEVHGGAAV
jgi:hypothetical protein